MTSLGVGTGALLGGDLTDPENDIDDTVSGGANFNWISASATSEPWFSPANGHESAFDVFDNKVGSGKTKWCCNAAPQNVAVEFDRSYQLTHFTIAAGNDTVGRDPTVWYIEGSNDGSNWTTIFEYNNPGLTPFAVRNEVLRYDASVDFEPPAFYSHFRYRVTQTNGVNNHQINEIELFGTPPESIATFNSSLGAPECSTVGDVCDSGFLLERSGNMDPPESNQPNTVGSCPDGNANSYYLDDESIEKIVVSGGLYQGSTVRVDVTFHPFSNGASNTVELYYTGDGANPNAAWSPIAVLQPTQTGLQTFSAEYVLPQGSTQRVRAIIVYDSNTPCSGSGFYDVDDLVFAVEESHQASDIFSGTRDVTRFSCQPGWAISGSTVRYGRSWDNSYSDSLTGISFSCAEMRADGTLDQSVLDQSAVIGDATNHSQGAVSCGGGLVTGLRGQKGGVIDKLGFMCSDADQALAGGFDAALGAPVGGAGGSPVERACPIGQVVTGMDVSVLYLTYGAHIRGVEPVCSDLVGAPGSLSLGGNNTTFSFYGGRDTLEFNCQDGWALSQTDVRYARVWDNSYANSLTGVSFACAEIDPDNTLDDSVLDPSPIAGDSANLSQGTAACNGRFVTGLRGNKGAVIDKLGLMCSTIDQVDSGTFDSSLGTPVGGSGGSYAESTCPIGYIGTGVKASFINLAYGPHINRIELICTENTDDDGDGRRRLLDNCPDRYNEYQGDQDGDGLGDACDPDYTLVDDVVDAAVDLCPDGLDDCDVGRLYKQLMSMESMEVEIVGGFWRGLFGLRSVDPLPAECYDGNGSNVPCFVNDLPDDQTLFDDIVDQDSSSTEADHFSWGIYSYDHEYLSSSEFVYDRYEEIVLLHPQDVFLNGPRVAINMKDPDCWPTDPADPWATLASKCKETIDPDNLPTAADGRYLNGSFSFGGNIYYLTDLTGAYFMNTCGRTFNNEQLLALLDGSASAELPAMHCGLSPKISRSLDLLLHRKTVDWVEFTNLFAQAAWQLAGFGLGSLAGELRLLEEAGQLTEQGLRLKTLVVALEAINSTGGVIMNGMMLVDAIHAYGACAPNDQECRRQQMGAIVLSGLFMGFDTVKTGLLLTELKTADPSLQVPKEEATKLLDTVHHKYGTMTGEPVDGAVQSKKPLASGKLKTHITESPSGKEVIEHEILPKTEPGC